MNATLFDTCDQFAPDFESDTDDTCARCGWHTDDHDES